MTRNNRRICQEWSRTLEKDPFDRLCEECRTPLLLKDPFKLVCPECGREYESEGKN